MFSQIVRNCIDSVQIPLIVLSHSTLILITGYNDTMTCFNHLFTVCLPSSALPVSQLNSTYERAAPHLSEAEQLSADMERSLTCIVSWKWKKQLLYKQKYAHKYICADIGVLLCFVFAGYQNRRWRRNRTHSCFGMAVRKKILQFITAVQVLFQFSVRWMKLKHYLWYDSFEKAISWMTSGFFYSHAIFMWNYRGNRIVYKKFFDKGSLLI